MTKSEKFNLEIERNLVCQSKKVANNFSSYQSATNNQANIKELRYQKHIYNLEVEGNTVILRSGQLRGWGKYSNPGQRTNQVIGRDSGQGVRAEWMGSRSSRWPWQGATWIICSGWCNLPCPLLCRQLRLVDTPIHMKHVSLPNAWGQWGCGRWG